MWQERPPFLCIPINPPKEKQLFKSAFQCTRQQWMQVAGVALTCGLRPSGHSRFSRRTAVYSPPNPPPRMHTRGPRPLRTSAGAVHACECALQNQQCTAFG
jgi:hypothetical protein